MRRRALLSSITAGAVGLAGCSALEGGGENRDPFGVPDEDSATETATTTNATTTTPSVGVRDPGVTVHADLEAPAGITRAVDWHLDVNRRFVLTPGPNAATPDGTVLSVGFTRPATRNSPARLWIGLENVSDSAQTLGFGATPPFSGYHGEDRPDRDYTGTDLVLIPDDDRNYASFGYAIPDAPDEDCWRAVGPVVTPEIRTVVDLPPGHGIGGEYVVLAPHDALHCLSLQGAIDFEDPDEGVGFAITQWYGDVAAPGDSQFDRTVPALPGFEQTVWYHEAESDTPVYLSPDGERLELPVDRTTVSLWNFSPRPLRFDPGGWDLYKLSRGTWKHVAPWILPTRSTTILPGEEHPFAVTVTNERDGGNTQSSSGAIVTDVGGGLYAIRYGGSSADYDRATGVVQVPAEDPPIAGEEPAVGFAALVSVVGPPLRVRPTGDVRSTSRSGSTLTVTVGNPDDRATLVLRRAPGEDPTIELIPEQVTQVPALRNAVAQLDGGIEEVRVVTDEFTATEPLDRYAPGAKELTLRYQGTTYVLTVE